jgi:hypothetical protein
MTEPLSNDEVPAKRTKASQVSLKALQYLTRPENLGLVVFIDDIADDTGFTQKQIAAAISYLRSRNATLAEDLKVVVVGKAWQYLPRQGFVKSIEPAVPVEPPAPTPTSTPPAPPAPVRREPVRRSRTARSDDGDGKLFEQIGRMGDGVLLKDIDKVVWVAHKLKTDA